MSAPVGKLGIALLDAASNCERDGAKAAVVLRSGVRYEGALNREGLSDPRNAHLRLDDGGWATIDRDEIAAVESRVA